MTHICINGGGFAGLSTALLLAADGHNVTIIERDPAPPSRDPESTWEDWERRAVPQFRQTHGYLDRVKSVLVDELPHVWTRLLEAGAEEHNLSAHPAPTASDRVLAAGEDDVFAVLCRRSTIETVLRFAAEDDPRIDVRSGVVAKGVLAQGSPPRAFGLATSAGPVEADIVVDCGGRRSAVPDWIEDVGGRRPPEHATDMRIAYWTQWFRLRPGAEMPVLRGRPMQEVGPIEVLRFPADNGWFSATIVATGGDERFRVLSESHRLVQALRRLEQTRDWADPDIADPVGDAMPMISAVDQHHRYVVDGLPCAEGLVAIGDSVGASNPSLGRGTSFALMHAVALRDLLRDGAGPKTISQRHDAALAEEFQPWWDATIAADQGQLGRMRAAVDGTEPDFDPAWMFGHAADHDVELWRALVQVGGVRRLPQDLMAKQPALLDKVGDTVGRVGPPEIIDLDVDALLAP